MNSDPDLDVRGGLLRVFHLWPRLMAFSMVGGLIGLGVAQLRPPLYQAGAVVAISIDYERVELVEEIQEDRALDRVWQLFVADDTLEVARSRLTEEYGPSEDWASIERLRDALRLEPRLSAWEFAAIHRDPETASRLANAWAETSLAQLDDAYEHAWEAVALQGGKLAIVCLEQRAEASIEDIAPCFAGGPELSSEEIAALLAEIRAARGILPALSYEWVHQAEPPSRPVVWARGTLVLAGALIGLILGVAATQRGRRLPALERIPGSASPPDSE